MTLDQLGRVLADLGVDRLHVLPFEAELASLDDEAFARQVLSEGLGARHVAAGFRHQLRQGPHRRSEEPAPLWRAVRLRRVDR